MKKLLLLVFVLGLIGFVPGRALKVGASSDPQDNSNRFLVLDVAFDARTFTFNHVNPASSDLARGDTFVLNGKVYPGDTIPRGGTPANPGPFTPDAPGSIAKFICRGTSLFDGAAVAAGAAPFVATTQTFAFDNGNWLFTEGLEGNFTPNKRLVTGGLGDFSRMEGEATMELLGFNATGMENYRFTFKLKK